MKILPGIKNEIPNIFAYTSDTNKEPEDPPASAYESALGNKTPTAFATKLDTLGEVSFGKTGLGMVVGGLGFLLLGISVFGMIFNVTQAVTPAMVLGIPILMSGALLGVLPLALVFGAFFFILILFGITFVMSRMA